MEDKDNEEYKNRIKELIERVEKDKDNPEGYQKLIEIEELKNIAITHTNPNFRNEKSIIAFTFIIREYYRSRADPNYSTEEGQFQEEIDALYKLIYEELRKSKKFTLFDDISDINKKGDKLDKKRIINDMTKVLGMENINRDFYKYYKISDIMRPEKYTKEIVRCILTLVFQLLL